MVKSACLTIVFFVTGNCLLYAQTELINNERFLADHLCVEDQEIYVFSEDNRLGSSVELRYTLITSLNQKCGVRNIITGSGTSEAWLYNQFLASGDTSLLMNTNGYDFTMMQDFWARLYNYNRNLPENSKIRFTGIGSEKPGPFKSMVSRFFTGEVREPEISMIFFEIMHYPQGGNTVKHSRSFYDLLSRFNSSLLKNRSAYLRYLTDDNYINLVIITGNPANNPSLYKQRQKMMYEQLASSEDLIPGKIIVLADPIAARNSPGTFEYLLDNEESSPYYGKVFNADTYYYKCTFQGEPLKFTYPGEYKKLINPSALESAEGNYFWLRSPSLTQCDYLLIVKNKAEIK